MSEKQNTKSPLVAAAKWIVAMVLLASLLLNVSTYLFPVVRHYGSSMKPTLSEDQIMILHKTDSVERGDIIAFYYNNNVMVRRVIACGGDTIDIDIFGKVKVNGEAVEEDYVETPALGQTNLQYPFTVPANSYFVMGDNREISMDSRLTQIGTVPKDRVVGKAMISFSID